MGARDRVCVLFDFFCSEALLGEQGVIGFLVEAYMQRMMNREALDMSDVNIDIISLR